MRISPLVRDGAALALAVLGIAALATVVVATAMDGEWGRVGLVALGAAACLIARAIGRYDPEEAAVRRAVRANLRNRPGPG